MTAKENDMVDLGIFGKFSRETLITNRQKETWFNEDKKPSRENRKWDIPEFIADMLNEKRRYLEKRRDRIGNEKHRRIGTISMKLEELAKFMKKLKEIDAVKEKVRKIVNEEA